MLRSFTDGTPYYSIFNCKIHGDAYECPDVMIVKEESKIYGIPIHDGGTSYITIDFCPWCGIKLVVPEQKIPHEK